jgi:hypothetical protein
MPVTEPSEWQKKYTRFSKVQHELLGKAGQSPDHKTMDNKTPENKSTGKTKSVA